MDTKLASLALGTLFLISHALPAQCNATNSSSQNWARTFKNSVDGSNKKRAIYWRNPNPFDIEVCRVDFRMRSLCGTSTNCGLEFYVGTGGKLGRRVRAGVDFRVGTTPSIYSAAAVTRLEAHGEYFLVLDYKSAGSCLFGGTGMVAPIATSGARTPGFALRDPRQGWVASSDAYMFRVHYRRVEAARFVSYGIGCGGQVACDTKPCESVNWNQNLRNIALARGTYAFRVKDDTNPKPTRDLCSIELFLGSNERVARDLRISIYDESKSAPGTVLGSTAMSVQPGLARAYRATFPAPIRIRAGQTYYVGLEVDFALVPPIEKFGGNNIAFRRSSSNWSRYTNLPWNLRTYCTTTARRIPALQRTGAPKLGETLTIRLIDAKPRAVSLFQLGTRSLDLDLKGIGAPGCRLLVDASLVHPVVSDSRGGAAFSIPVPNSIPLLGAEFYSQWAVFDGANALGFSFSNGGKGTVGNL